MSNGTSLNLSYEGLQECQETAVPFRQIILAGVLTPGFISFGLCANLLNISVFSHRTMRESLVNWYLLCLAASDLVSLFCAVFIICLPVIAEWSQTSGLNDVAMWLMPVVYPTAMITQTISVYLTVCVSAHRFIGVCLPFRAADFCTSKNVRTNLVVVFMFGAIYNLPKFFELTSQHCYSHHYNTSTVTMAESPLRLNQVYIMGYLCWSYTFVMLFIPFLLLILMNIRVIAAVQQTRKRHALLAGSDDPGAKMEAAKERSTTVMLIGIVITFLTCNCLALVSNILEIVMREWSFLAETLYAPYKTICDISNLLVLVNMSLNVFIYLSFSERYRLVAKFYLFALLPGRDAKALLDGLTKAANV